MKKKLYIISFLLMLFFLSVSLTYSIFNDKTDLTMDNKNFAKFIFNTDTLDEINLPLVDLKPGDTKEYNFSISNNKDNKKSDVSLEYSISLETYHFIPLDIKLYLVCDKEELVLNCDESIARNSQNKLECLTESKKLNYNSDEQDSYKLVIHFDENFNGYEYSSLVDYITLKVKSWQKVVG